MPESAFIFDNDNFSVGFLQVVLADLGLEVRAFSDAATALDEIKKALPRVVFLDTMVPGAEGFALCSAIKADPALKGVKVVVASGKVYEDDQARAGWARADLYVHKPIDPETLYDEIQKILPGLRQPQIEGKDGSLPEPEATLARAMMSEHPTATPEEKKKEAEGRPWTLKFWGSGLDADTISLVDKGRLLVFDAGQGLKPLAAEPVPAGVTEVWLFISHFHKGHLAGLEHAKRWADAGLKLFIVGPSESEKMLGKAVQRALPGVQAELLAVGAGAFTALADLDVQLMYTMHPGPCFAFRVATPTRSVVIAPDSELPPEVPDHTERLARFAFGADVLVHDARYSDADYPQFERRGHAHTTAALDLALRADARCLTLCHVDPKYNAAARVRMLSGTLAHSQEGMKLEYGFLACPGLEIEV